MESRRSAPRRFNTGPIKDDAWSLTMIRMSPEASAPITFPMMAIIRIAQTVMRMPRINISYPPVLDSVTEKTATKEPDCNFDTHSLLRFWHVSELEHAEFVGCCRLCRSAQGQ